MKQMIKMEINSNKSQSTICGSALDISAELAMLVGAIKKSFVNSGMSCGVAEAVLRDCFNMGLTIADGERE
jgi:hypothetical protein